MCVSCYLLQYAYSVLLAVITALLIYGCTEEEWGMGPNVVRVLTYGHYNYSMAIPTLCTSIVICLLTVCYHDDSFSCFRYHLYYSLGYELPTMYLLLFRSDLKLCGLSFVG